MELSRPSEPKSLPVWRLNIKYDRYIATFTGTHTSEVQSGVLNAAKTVKLICIEFYVSSYFSYIEETIIIQTNQDQQSAKNIIALLVCFPKMDCWWENAMSNSYTRQKIIVKPGTDPSIYWKLFPNHHLCNLKQY